jgi:hypothetical protein
MLNFILDHSKVIGFSMAGFGAVVFVASWIKLYRAARRPRPWNGGF